MPEPAALGSVGEVSRRLAALRDRVTRPLTLAVLGEVKAGKSTLVNALVGTDVAPTDVLEATQWVMEVRNGPEPHAFLRFVDGSTQEGTPHEIHDLLFSQRHNPEFVSRCVEVVVTLPQQTLTHLHLIDTPGLATVTEQAAARTRRHLAHVDAVLWVLNANHLGQVDVTDELADVARMGKPIFAVVNRVDEVEGDPARLVRYVRTRLAEYVQEVFATSTRMARQAQLVGNDELLEASGLPQLREFLEQQVDRRAGEVQSEALSQQLLALLQLEEALHESYARELEFLIKETGSHFHRLDLERRRIQSEAEVFIKDEFDSYFLGLAQEFAARVPDARGFDEIVKNFFLRGNTPGALAQGLESEMRSALGGERFTAWVEKLGSSIEMFMRKKWEEATGKIEVQLRERFHAFYAGELRWLDTMDAGVGASEIIEGLKDGLTAGGMIGAGLAAYAATLGPGAAWITMGTALGAILPPALVVGAGVGIAMRFLQANRQAERLRIAIRDAVEKHKQKVRSEWLEPTVLPALAQFNASIADALKRSFTEKLCQGWSMEELEALARAVAAYVAECRALRQQLHEFVRGVSA